VRCPWCRETIPALKRAPTCPHCGKSIETDAGAQLRTLDLDYDAILADADARSLRWCGRGAVFAFVVALFSLVPVVGAAVASVLLVIGQFLWTGLLIARPYHRHFSPLRRLVTRWVRRLALVFVVVPAHTATFLPFVGLVAAPAVFYVACRLVRAYARFHLVREKERLPVTTAEKALVVVLAGVLLFGLCLVGLLVYLGVLALDSFGG
jgi:hypothetical protein